MGESGPGVTEFVVPIRVRYVECDPMNVAHHSVYPVWMELGRTELLRAQGAVYRECEERGIYFVVARMNIRYRRPIRYDDEIEVHVVGLPCAGVKVEHTYAIRRDGELMASAETTLVCVTDQGKPVPVPEGLVP
ncbi:MAG: thioesterase family protein [Planctomycetota bacterium]